jgi:hypothetical protein
MPVLNEAPYKVNTAVNPAITEEGINWLRALGVEAMVVNGPASTDEYKDIRAPERFDGVLPLGRLRNRPCMDRTRRPPALRRTLPGLARTARVPVFQTAGVR